MGPSGPACGEQCEDLLNRYGRPKSPTGELVDLENGLAAVERTPLPRSKEAVNPSRRADGHFDPYEQYKRDLDQVTSLRHTSSLLLDMKAQLMTPPAWSDDVADRAYRIEARWDELDRRSLHAESIIRFGIVEQLAASMAIQVVMKELLAEVQVDGPPPPRDPAWLELFGLFSMKRGSAVGTRALS